MVVIMGWGDGKSKDLGEVAPTTCPQCRNDVFLHEVQSEKQFSLYFIPLGSYNKNRYLLCPICQFGVPLQPGDEAASNNMRAATAVYRRGTVDPSYYRNTVDQFWQRVGRGPNGAALLRAPATIPATSGRPGQPNATPAAAAGRSAPAGAGADAHGPNFAEQIKSLAKLHDDGVLTDAEFAAAKRRVMEQ